MSRRSGSKVAEPHSLLQELKHALVERLVEDDAAFASTGPNDGREDFNRTRTDQQLLTGACALARPELCSSGRDVFDQDRARAVETQRGGGKGHRLAERAPPSAWTVDPLSKPRQCLLPGRPYLVP